MRFNAMEVINSGATQTDRLQLARDWMALLNRGYQVTPVGSSDSHDVSRYIVGQGGRTFAAMTRMPGKFDVVRLVENFLQGRVTVSYGLLVDLQVNGRFGPGDLATAEGDEVAVKLRVLGPHWTEATRIHLYQNGKLIRDEAIPPPFGRRPPRGVHWSGEWKIPRPPHDAHLVAVALGTGIDGPHWATAKPYQPTSPDFKSNTLSVSGAVRLDGNRDGKWTSPRAQGEQVYEKSKGDLVQLAEFVPLRRGHRQPDSPSASVENGSAGSCPTRPRPRKRSSSSRPRHAAPPGKPGENRNSPARSRHANPALIAKSREGYSIAAKLL